MTRSTFSMVRLVLPDMDERERSQMEIANEITEAVRNENAARAFVQQQSTFGGRRAGMPIQYILQAPNIEKLQEFIPKSEERRVGKECRFRLSTYHKKKKEV